MKALALTALAALASTALAELSSEYVIAAPIARRSVPRREAISERDTTAVDLKNDYLNLQYTMNVSIGTPPQPVTLQLDTGSTDLWVVTPDACQAALRNESTQGNITNCGGTYDITRSSTGRMIPGGRGQFSATYQDGTGALEGDYISDTVSIGKWSLQNYTIGQGTNVDTIPGLIGVGFDQLEAGYQEAMAGSSESNEGDLFSDSESSGGSDSSGSNAQPYPAILSSLLDAGFIKTRSFSLWLDDLDESTGTILFGGYDSAKVAGGQLTMLPMQNDSSTGVIDRYLVTLTSVGVTIASNGGTKSTVMTPNRYAVAATLDSGTSFSDVPDYVLTMVASALGAQMDDTLGAYVVDCSLALAAGSLDFQFGGTTGPVVGVPFSEIVLPLIDPTTEEDYKGPSGKGLCQLGLSGVDDATGSYEGLVLGDTFLRSAYVYYNLDTLSIGLGQTVYSATQSNVQEVSNNRTLPQGATSVASTVTVPTPTATPPMSSSVNMEDYETATAITARPATSLNAAAISGQPTSYTASLPTVAGKPGPRASAEAKGSGVIGADVKGGASGLQAGNMGSTALVVFAAACGIAMLQ